MADEYKCECTECGHKFTSEKHCNESACPKCGGDSRREDKPGDGKENRTEEMNKNILRLSTGRASNVELVEDDEEKPTYKIKFELMDVGTYNMFNFSEKNLDFMVAEFNSDKNGVVSHGLDHSWETLDQIGRVFEVVKEGKGKSAKVFALSELYKETPAQAQSYTLFKQGLLKFVSGGWIPESMDWNDETSTIDITNPKLREMSSTPMPAKQDAKAKEILQSLNHSLKNGNNDNNIELSKEDKPMSKEDENPDEPSEEGIGVSESETELAALKEQYKTELASLKTEREAISTKANEEMRVSLLERAKELGLSEELFKDSTNDAIDLALKAAKEVQVSELQKREPENNFGGQGDASLKDGSPEMVAKLEAEYFNWGDLDREMN